MKFIKVKITWDNGSQSKVKDYDLDSDISVSGLRNMLVDEMNWLRNGDMNMFVKRLENFPDTRMRIISHSGFLQKEIDGINLILDNL